jgi:GNAT superfamily N-acetyltransferase
MKRKSVDVLPGIRFSVMKKTDQLFLKEMLYGAIYLPPDEKEKLSRDIIYRPELRIYFEHWGRSGDKGIIAITETDEIPVGCVWARLYNEETGKGYGFVSKSIPELSIAVYPAYRNRGIGAMLIHILLATYRQSGFDAVSLSVSKHNPAVRLYRRTNFITLRVTESDFVMINRLQEQSQRNAFS